MSATYSTDHALHWVRSEDVRVWSADAHGGFSIIIGNTTFAVYPETPDAMLKIADKMADAARQWKKRVGGAEK
jgi:hypothetical protein